MPRSARARSPPKPLAPRPQALRVTRSSVRYMLSLDRFLSVRVYGPPMPRLSLRTRRHRWTKYTELAAPTATTAIKAAGVTRPMSNRQFRRPRAISAPRSAGSTLFRTTAPMLFAFWELKSRPTSKVNGAVPRVAYSQSSLLPGLTWAARPSWSTWYPFAYAISIAKLLSRSSSAVGNRVYDQGYRTHWPAL